MSCDAGVNRSVAPRPSSISTVVGRDPQRQVLFVSQESRMHFLFFDLPKASNFTDADVRPLRTPWDLYIDLVEQRAPKAAHAVCAVAQSLPAFHA
jgi:hypothetical protein